MEPAHATIVQLPATEGTAITPLATEAARPLLSVMLPVYEPNEFLLEALRSVLSQDLGPENMQIAIVDDASTRDIQALVAQVAPPGRVDIYRSAVNQGLAGNWNQCIRVARGHVVHILHQDDWVAEGFYANLLPVFSKHPRIGMAFCRYAIAESKERTVRYSHRERLRAGVLKNWLERIAERQRVQCASVLVRRDVYETLGGYRTDLCYALDWEMWVRIAVQRDVWYEPRKMAFYRRHEESETRRLSDDNKTARDVVEAIKIFAGYLPPENRQRLLSLACTSFAQRTLKQLSSKVPDSRQSIVDLLQPVREVLELAAIRPALAKRFAKSIDQLERQWRRI